MAGQSILQFLSDLLLRVIPSPEIWGLFLVVIFAAYMVFRKFPASASSHISMILILSLVTMVGGVFDILRIVMFAVSGGVFFLGIWNFMGKR